MVGRIQADTRQLTIGLISVTSALVALALARLPKTLELGRLSSLNCRRASVVVGSVSVAAGALALLGPPERAGTSATSYPGPRRGTQLSRNEAARAQADLEKAMASGRVHGRELEPHFAVVEPSQEELSEFYPIASEIRKCERGCVHIAESIGGRASMEDCLFVREEKSGLLLGVLDGHAGGETARYLADAFPDLFFSTLDNHPDWSPYRCLESVVPVLDERVCAQFADGATAVVCFVTEEQIYTLTLGDASADLFYSERKKPSGRFDIVDGSGFPVREVWMGRRSTPLSPLIDWTDTDEQARVHPDRFLLMEGRLFGPTGGLNVSRAFGDRAFKPGGVGIEPFITVVDRPRDNKWRLILGCDGWKDGLDAERQGVLVDGWDAGRFPQFSNLAALSAYRALDAAQVLAAPDNTTIMAFVPHSGE